MAREAMAVLWPAAAAPCSCVAMTCTGMDAAAAEVKLDRLLTTGAARLAAASAAAWNAAARLAPTASRGVPAGLRCRSLSSSLSITCTASDAAM